MQQHDPLTHSRGQHPSRTSQTGRVGNSAEPVDVRKIWRRRFRRRWAQEEMIWEKLLSICSDPEISSAPPRKRLRHPTGHVIARAHVFWQYKLAKNVAHLGHLRPRETKTHMLASRTLSLIPPIYRNGNVHVVLVWPKLCLPSLFLSRCWIVLYYLLWEVFSAHR